jgi:acetate kinase
MLTVFGRPGLSGLHGRRRRKRQQRSARIHLPRVWSILGIRLDPEKNKRSAARRLKISAADSKVTVWVIPTNEELMIAQDTAALCKAAN